MRHDHRTSAFCDHLAQSRQGGINTGGVGNFKEAFKGTLKSTRIRIFFPLKA
jgi:hypothetical protein